MPDTAVKTLTLKALRKASDAIAMVEASLTTTAPYDPSVTYTAKEREPYDALSDRFIRAVEVSVRFFRSYERLMYAENSDTYRDLLNRMEKLGIISSTAKWIDMREVRNRIVHDYLPAELKGLYDDLMGDLGDELKRLQQQLASRRSHVADLSN